METVEGMPGGHDMTAFLPDDTSCHYFGTLSASEARRHARREFLV